MSWARAGGAGREGSGGGRALPATGAQSALHAPAPTCRKHAAKAAACRVFSNDYSQGCLAQCKPPALPQRGTEPHRHAVGAASSPAAARAWPAAPAGTAPAAAWGCAPPPRRWSQTTCAPAAATAPPAAAAPQPLSECRVLSECCAKGRHREFTTVEANTGAGATYSPAGRSLHSLQRIALRSGTAHRPQQAPQKGAQQAAQQAPQHRGRAAQRSAARRGAPCSAPSCWRRPPPG